MEFDLRIWGFEDLGIWSSILDGPQDAKSATSGLKSSNSQILRFSNRKSPTVRWTIGLVRE